MKSQWDETHASTLQNDPLLLRVYTSRLLGAETDLVLHGGGNTSVKVTVKNFFNQDEHVLYVKGSGWDLASIEAPGFAAVRMSVLLQLADLEELSDEDMVTQQRAGMLNPHAPNPSVEAILHAIIPFKFVDHTHADAVVTLTNNVQGMKGEIIHQLYGDRVLVIPYVMPGFLLAREIRQRTKDIQDWSQYEGMILMNHGVFTFADDAKTSYERMIAIVSQAEEYLQQQKAYVFAEGVPAHADANTTMEERTKAMLELAHIRNRVSLLKGQPMLACLNDSPRAVGFSNLDNVASIATRGPITPDHVIRTKAIPVVFAPSSDDDDSNDQTRQAAAAQEAIQTFDKTYQTYFQTNHNPKTRPNLQRLDTAPRWAVWPRHGTLSFDRTYKATRIITDITEHTMKCIQMGEQLGGWEALSEKDLFDMEYWSLEQAKLGKKGGGVGVLTALQGKVALVTGAASGIGKACAEKLHAQGAAVVGLDKNPTIVSMFENTQGMLGLNVDMTDEDAVRQAICQTVQTYGGLDILVSNAGMFPSSQTIENLSLDLWETSLNVNLNSQRALLRYTIPFLKLGMDSAVVFIGSRNVTAPGPGAAAYSVAKAGLTQLARVAALEWAGDGVRVNIVHPDCVYDTGIWTEEVLQSRAKKYGMTVEEYQARNLLRTAVTSEEVARMVCAMAGDVFVKTTGAQVPIDGGSERVI